MLMSEKIQVVVLPGHVLDDNIKKVLPGDVVELDEREARTLLVAGIVDLAQLAARDELEAAIDRLDPENQEQWTKDGRPTTDALAAIVSRPVTANQRDTAWALFKEQQ